jgi:hypothetical protein
MKFTVVVVSYEWEHARPSTVALGTFSTAKEAYEHAFNKNVMSRQNLSCSFAITDEKPSLEYLYECDKSYVGWFDTTSGYLLYVDNCGNDSEMEPGEYVELPRINMNGLDPEAYLLWPGNVITDEPSRLGRSIIEKCLEEMIQYVREEDYVIMLDNDNISPVWVDPYECDGLCSTFCCVEKWTSKWDTE